ncbi:T6SS immunity protein Tdi1 domain-containing protein [Leptospira saintgironsiae]|uniref:DUF1851 domain-containing protein n=1 Tax=Leptospira saintgironsiae TaxID=2023183 RepID=A0A2M9Y7A9_9LEPT|nr:T6SS immunity protein Tdi1 domain-containing protein [Leptospira saintgironsiae]PJZ47470.1 DUF1851 domain-containing protein [Leptospira saintgironsiae]
MLETILNVLKDSWGWTGLDPEKIIKENEFGNLLILDRKGQYWRLCPEDLYCEIIAINSDKLTVLLDDQDFIEDWEMKSLVDLAFERYGQLPDGRKYCLKIPGTLGGEYKLSNISTISFIELIQYSGDVALQIKDLPDGSKVQLKFID